MRWLRTLVSWAVCSTALWYSAPTWAGGSDPVRLIPEGAELVVRVENPRRLANIVYHHELIQEFYKIDGVRDLFDTTNFRRFLQLLAYYEKELGHPPLDLLDQVAGDGLTLAAKFSGTPSVLFIVQGKDEKKLARFMQISLEIAEQELARKEVKEKLRKGTYRKIETIHLGKDFNLARAGTALIFASQAKGLEAALELHLGGKQKSLAQAMGFIEAKKSLPKDPLAWVWLNLESARQIPQVKEAFETLGLDPNSLFVYGGLVDVVKRSPYLVASVRQEGKGFMTSIQMPRGKEGMSGRSAMFLPEKGPGSLPILQPPRVLASSSYFLDLGSFWDNRAKILNPEQVKGLEEADANSAKFLVGTKLSTILKQAGSHHRLVVAQQEKSPYKIKPATVIPAFALVVEMRDPAFAKSMNTVLRTAALFGTFGLNLKMMEEKHQGHTLVSYYFQEDKKNENDKNNVRFNFSPCFAHVGNQFIMSSTVELGRDLLDILEKESKKDTSLATTRTHLFAAGGAAALKAAEDQLLTQAILSQALPPASARKQIQAFIDLVAKLGILELEVRYGDNDFRYDIRWKPGK